MDIQTVAYNTPTHKEPRLHEKVRQLLTVLLVILTPFWSFAYAADTLQGFADFLYERNDQGISSAYNTIIANSDIIVYHHDNGVPWNEALWGLPYGNSIQAEWQRRQQFVPDELPTYVAVTPLSFLRDGLASYRNDRDNQPLPWPWNVLELDHPYVMRAYLNHCLRMIDMYEPDYFAYAIEGNLLWQQAPQKWPAFIQLVRYVYTNLKQRHPELPVFVTLQVDAVHENLEQIAIAQQLLAYSDVVALSSYAYVRYPDPTTLPADYFSLVSDLAPGKPVAVAETGWPAENITDPFPVFIPASEAGQALYLNRLLQEFRQKNALFVNWILVKDFDALWDDELSQSDNAPLLRQWKDIGMIDGNGWPRYWSWWIWNAYRSH